MLNVKFDRSIYEVEICLGSGIFRPVSRARETTIAVVLMIARVKPIKLSTETSTRNHEQGSKANRDNPAARMLGKFDKDRIKRWYFEDEPQP